MSIEAGKTFGVTARETGKKALTFSARAAVPLGTIGALTATILLGMHGQKDNEFSPRVKIEIASILLSLAIFSAPSVGKKIVDNLKKNKPKATFPEPKEP